MVSIGDHAARCARWRAVRIGLAIVVACCGSHATIDAQELTRAVRLAVDNDYFNLWLPPLQRPDDNYTQGARTSVDLASSPRFVRALLCPAGVACGTNLEIGQEIYTPSIDARWPIPGARPYAGWLYGRVTALGGRQQTMRSLAVTVGVTGPPSLAEAVQTGFHERTGFRMPAGWAYQLPTEVGFEIRASQSWHLRPRGSLEHVVDVVPAVRAAAGTLRTAAAFGVRARVGPRLRHPWLTSEFAGVAPYGFVGIGADAVVRDLFLDGTLFRESVHADRTPLLAEWEWGAGVHVRRLCLEYRAVTRTREYAAGPRWHSFGSVTASWRR